MTDRVASRPEAPAEARPSAALRNRWARALAVLLAILTLGVAANAVATRTISGAFRDVAVRMERDAAALAELRSAIVATALVRSAAVQRLGAGPQDVKEAAEAEEASFARAIATLRPGGGREVVQRHLQQARALWRDDILSLSPAQFAAKVAEARANFDLIDEAAAASRTAARADLDRAAGLERSVTTATATGTLLVVLLAVRFARRLSREVLRPVAALRRSANRLAAGDLDHRVAVDGDDEIGELASSFNTMAEVVARSHRELVVQANHDPLTGLANRTAFEARLHHVLAQPERRDGTQAVLFVDLDDFKDVNDAFGHAAGDQVLRAVAGRLAEAVRPGDLVARLGGDEFALVLDGVPEAAAALEVAERAVAALSAPVDVAGTPVRVGASAGLALRHHGSDPPGLMREADMAMYRAKRQGKNRVLRFTDAMSAAPAPQSGAGRLALPRP